MKSIAFSRPIEEEKLFVEVKANSGAFQQWREAVVTNSDCVEGVKTRADSSKNLTR